MNIIIYTLKRPFDPGPSTVETVILNVKAIEAPLMPGLMASQVHHVGGGSDWFEHVTKIDVWP